MTQPTITVGTWNVKRGGWNDTTRLHDLDALVGHVARATPAPPDILGWPEATYCLDEGQAVLRRLVNLLSDLLPDNQRYEPFVTELDGHRNHPLLLVNTTIVEVERWYAPNRPNTRRVYWGWARATVAGIPGVWLSCQHWSDADGPTGFAGHAARVATFARQAAIVVGDFNQTSSWPGEHPVDWHERTATEPHRRWQKGVYDEASGRWRLDTTAIDFLRQAGFRDLGELAEDGTPTSHDEMAALRIDRIMLGHGLPAALRPDSYRVHPIPCVSSRPVSDHAYITATLTLTCPATVRPA